jgi:hypothetical protein
LWLATTKLQEAELQEEEVEAFSRRYQKTWVSVATRWVAYVSDESGQSQVYVRPFLRPGGRWLLSIGQAFAPLWASNSELTYIDPTAKRLVEVRLTFDPNPRVTSRTDLLDWSSYRMANRSVAHHDISRDGQRFLALRVPGLGSRESTPVVVLNWFEEVRRRVAGYTGEGR